MKTRSHRFEFSRVLLVGLMLTVPAALALTAAEVPTPDPAAAVQRLQEQVDQQTRRLDRLYRALGPFLEEWEARAIQIEKAQQQEKARAFNTAVQVAVTQGDYPEALHLLGDKLETERAQLGATNRQTRETLRRLADLSGCVGDWAGCVRHSRKWLEISDYDELVARGCAAAALLAGDERTYREVCARMVVERGVTEDAIQAERTAKACLLAPNALADPGPALRLAAQAANAKKEDPWFRLVQGMAEFRSDHAEEALRWLEPVLSSEQMHAATLAGYVTSLAHDRLGTPAQAQAALTAANARLDAFLRQGVLAAVGWERWYFDPAASIILRAEAEKAVLGKPASPLPTIASLAAARRSYGMVHVRLGCDYPAELLVPAAWKASWSPDGQQLAFGKQGGGIAVLDLQSRRVTNLASEGKDPAWSPDGKSIAYVTANGEDYVSEEVWIVPVADGDPVKIGKGGFPSWSGDSAQVRFHRRSLNRILSARVNAPDEPPSVFFAEPLSWYPAISPDGARIAFGTSEKLTVLDRETGQTIASLATPDEGGLLPAWSPDGRQVAFGGFAGSRAGLWVFDLERGGAFQVAKNPGCTMPAWSPDGERLAFDLRGQTNEVWVLNTRSFPRESVLTNQLPSRASSRARLSDSPVMALVDKPVPGPFKLALLEGGELLLFYPQTTNVLLLDFWASWCGPCRQVMPVLAEIARDYASRGVRYVAVNLREKPDVIRRYLATAQLQLTVALDPEGRLAEAFHVQGIPTMILVDRENLVRQVQVGASPEVGQELRRALDGLLCADP